MEQQVVMSEEIKTFSTQEVEKMINDGTYKEKLKLLVKTNMLNSLIMGTASNGVVNLAIAEMEEVKKDEDPLRKMLEGI